MRVAFVLGEFPCLSETFILTQLVGLKRRGVDVHVFAWSRTSALVGHELLREVDLDCQVTYWAVAPRGIVRRFVYVLSRLARNLVARPAVVLRSSNIFRFGRHALSGNLVAWAEQFLSQGKFDVCHAHFGTQGRDFERILAVAQPNLPLVVSFYGFDLTSQWCAEQPQAYASLFRKRALLLPLSEHFRVRLLGLGAAESRVVVHHLGVDVDRFAASQDPQRPSGPVRVLSVGRFVEKKGLGLALCAVAMARDAGVELRYTMVGGGPLRVEFERIISDLGLEAVVRMTGPLAQEDVSRTMRESDILLAPSLTASNGDEEGTPTVILEAMATGLVVIASKHAGIPEMVRDELSGRLVAENDAEELGAVLIDVARSPECWPAMGDAGRAIVQRDFNAAHLVDRLMVYYREVLARCS